MYICIPCIHLHVVPNVPELTAVVPLFSIVYLTWAEPTPFVGEITNYEVSYTIGSGSPMDKQVDGTVRTASYAVTEESAGQMHSIRIRARTSQGWGDFSNPFTFTFQPVGKCTAQLNIYISVSK